MRVAGVFAQTADFVLFVFLEVAFKPFDVAVALVGKDMGGQTIQEPAVVRSDQHAAGVVHDAFFQRAQGIDVKIVGRFVKNQ